MSHHNTPTGGRKKKGGSDASLATGGRSAPKKGKVPQTFNTNDELEPNAINGESELSMSERTNYITTNLIGTTVQVQVRDGTIYEGIFHSSSAKPSGLSIVLKMAKRRAPGEPSVPVQPPDTVTIEASEFVQLIAKDVLFIEDETPKSRRTFRTDTEISGAGELRHRELQRWEPDSELPAELDSEEVFDTNKHGTGWDQFAVNEKLFGVRTTFQEELYTTPLDRESAEYRERHKEADRIAAEILRETGNSRNVHLLEERGEELSDAMDEEDRYGAVIRNNNAQPSSRGRQQPPPSVNTTASGKYIPPAKRAQQQQQQQPSPAGSVKSTKPPTDASSENGAAARPAAAAENVTEEKTTAAAAVGTQASEASANQDAQSKATPLLSPRSTGSPPSASSSPGSTSPVLSGAGSPKLAGLSKDQIAAQRLQQIKQLAPSSPKSGRRGRSGSMKTGELASAAAGESDDQISALALESTSPKLPPAVLQNFQEFKERTEKQKRAQTLDQLKKFGSEFKVPTSPSLKPATPPAVGSVSSPPMSGKPADSTSTVDDKPADSTSAVDDKPTQPIAEKKDTATPAAASGAPSSSANAPSAATKPTATSKLNPNAKVFTPMSASAKPFVPASMLAAAPAPIPLATAQPFVPRGMPLAMPAPAVSPVVDPNQPLSEMFAHGAAKRRKIAPERSETVSPVWPGARHSFKQAADEDASFAFPGRPPVAVAGMPPTASYPIPFPAPIPTSPGGSPLMPGPLKMPPGAVVYSPSPAGMRPVPVAAPQPAQPGAPYMYAPASAAPAGKPPRGYVPYGAPVPMPAPGTAGGPAAPHMPPRGVEFAPGFTPPMVMPSPYRGGGGQDMHMPLSPPQSGEGSPMMKPNQPRPHMMPAPVPFDPAMAAPFPQEMEYGRPYGYAYGQRMPMYAVPPPIVPGGTPPTSGGNDVDAHQKP